jgi:hypothetical protein
MPVASIQDVEEHLKATLAGRWEIRREIGEGGMAVVMIQEPKQTPTAP